MSFFGEVTSTLLDEDFATSQSSKKYLRACLNNSQKIISAGSILQLQNILNISVPKEDRELPQSYHLGTDVLKLVLSDGDVNICALLYNSSPELSMKTPPGTKIRIVKPVSISHGTFCLSTDVYEVLGGCVPNLVEKWKLQKKFNVKQEWGCSTIGTEGPPLWKPFGYSSTSGIDVVALRKMKAMDIVNDIREEGAKPRQDKKTEFEVQRDQALKDINENTSKKNWCPPAKNLMDKELADLLKEGFLLEEAEEALKKYKNPIKALNHLKGTKFPGGQQCERKEKTKWRNVKGDEEDAAPVPQEYQRPKTNISLFGFIGKHINPEPPQLKPSCQEIDEDYQLALQMSIDSFKRESEFRCGDNEEFPIFQHEFANGKSQNSHPKSSTTFSRYSSNHFGEHQRKEKWPNVKSDFPPRHRQYYASNKYNNNEKDGPTTRPADDGCHYRGTYSDVSYSANPDLNQSHYTSSGISSSVSYAQARQVQTSKHDCNLYNYAQPAVVSTRYKSDDDKKKGQLGHRGKK